MKRHGWMHFVILSSCLACAASALADPPTQDTLSRYDNGKPVASGHYGYALKLSTDQLTYAEGQPVLISLAIANRTSQEMEIPCDRPPFTGDLQITDSTAKRVLPTLDLGMQSMPGGGLHAGVPIAAGASLQCLAETDIAKWGYALAPGSYTLRIFLHERIYVRHYPTASNTVTITITR